MPDDNNVDVDNDGGAGGDDGDDKNLLHLIKPLYLQSPYII